MKKLIYAAFLIALGNAKAQSVNVQEITTRLNTMKDLSIRPSVQFLIPPLGLRTKAALPINITVDAQYWLKKVADFRVGVSLGSIIGGTFGGTYHMVDKIKNANHKFVISRSTSGRTETTKYFRRRGDVRRIFGPAVDVTLGTIPLGNTNAFLTRVDFGIDIQTFSRVWAITDIGSFKSGKNGWISLKIQGVYMNAAKATGLGGMANLNANVSPWRTISIFAGLQMGAMRTALPKSTVPSGLPVKTSSIDPIFSFNLGAAINLIKVKQ